MKALTGIAIGSLSKIRLTKQSCGVIRDGVSNTVLPLNTPQGEAKVLPEDEERPPRKNDPPRSRIFYCLATFFTQSPNLGPRHRRAGRISGQNRAVFRRVVIKCDHCP
jgi:hypothetical protein